jgi:hypothetical protein
MAEVVVEWCPVAIFALQFSCIRDAMPIPKYRNWLVPAAKGAGFVAIS